MCTSVIRVIITLMMEAVRTSETSVYSNVTTRRYIPEGKPCLFLLSGVGINTPEQRYEV
jgi:hypothetical protein